MRGRYKAFYENFKGKGKIESMIVILGEIVLLSRTILILPIQNSFNIFLKWIERSITLRGMKRSWISMYALDVISKQMII